MALHEVRDRLVRGVVLDLQEGQGRTSAAIWQGSAVTHFYVEVGKDHHGLDHKVTKDNEVCGCHIGYYG